MPTFEDAPRFRASAGWPAPTLSTQPGAEFQPLRDVLTQNTYPVVKFMPAAVLRRNMRLVLAALEHCLPRDPRVVDRWLDCHNFWAAELLRREGEGMLREIGPQ